MDKCRHVVSRHSSS